MSTSIDLLLLIKVKGLLAVEETAELSLELLEIQGTTRKN